MVTLRGLERDDPFSKQIGPHMPTRKGLASAIQAMVHFYLFPLVGYPCNREKSGSAQPTVACGECHSPDSPATE